MRPYLACLVAGARPNFVKAAALHHAFQHGSLFRVRLVDTGQHYDDAMAGSFFRELGLDRADAALNVGSASHAVQTARVLERFERELLEHQPDVVIVVGDVNSTLACAVAAAKLQYPDGRRPLVAHVEAGLRSFDRAMPEEINRIVTDSIADLHFVTEQSGIDNLLREGHASEQMFLVGNVMMDTLLAHAPRAHARAAWERFELAHGNYGVVTLHRPSNVDDPDRLLSLIAALRSAARRLPLVFPVHPRTRARLDSAGHSDPGTLITCEPLPYVDFLSLLCGARAVITDSGGIQEETTMLGVPCLTLRDSTERPITITHGTNRLIGSAVDAIVPALDSVLDAPPPRLAPPPLWDGSAATRIVGVLERTFVAGIENLRARSPQAV
jgi:UDP-N-acetylglucosamine 2-epimerase (non-hydrolysing)